MLLMSGLANSANAQPPDEPRIVNMEALGKKVGKHGGTMKLLMAKPKDIRMMVIYSGTRLVSYDDGFKLAPDILKSSSEFLIH